MPLPKEKYFYRYPELENQVVIVTGGGSGIGQALVSDLLRNKARVVSIDLDNDATRRLIAEQSDAAGEVLFKTLDVADSAACGAAVDEAHARYGRIDGLLNVAAIAPRCDFSELTDEVLQRVIAVNLNGTLYPTRAVLRHMIPRRRGRIVNFASRIAISGHPGQSAYAATKGAVRSFSRNLALEVAQYGITVNTIFPTADTPIRREETPEEVRRVQELGIPQPYQVTSGILFWLSDAAREWTANELRSHRPFVKATD